MGRKMTLWRGVADTWGQVGSGSGEAERRTGVSSALGWLAGLVARVGPACARSRAGQWAEQAEPAIGLLLFFSFFCFIFLLLYLNSKLVYLIHWSFRYETHNTLLYILVTLFSYFV